MPIKVDDNTKRCPYCSGTGVIYDDLSRKGTIYERPCHDCDGDGVVCLLCGRPGICECECFFDDDGYVNTDGYSRGSGGAWPGV